MCKLPCTTPRPIASTKLSLCNFQYLLRLSPQCWHSNHACYSFCHSIFHALTSDYFRGGHYRLQDACLYPRKAVVDKARFIVTVVVGDCKIVSMIEAFFTGIGHVSTVDSARSRSLRGRPRSLRPQGRTRVLSSRKFFSPCNMDPTVSLVGRP